MTSLALWLFFTVSAIFGMVGYDIAIKAATDKANAFAFTTILALSAFIAHLAIWGGYKYFNPETPTKLSSQSLLLAIGAGLGLVIMDVGFFLGVRSGGLIRTNSVWLIGGLVLTVLCGCLFFGEYLNFARTLGIVLGVASILLMVLG
jgi:drug/metabolite transporter (DMT)-like permease